LAKHLLRKSNTHSFRLRNFGLFRKNISMVHKPLPVDSLRIKRYSLFQTSLRKFSSETTEQQAKNYEDPAVPSEVMENLKAQVQKISQAMALGEYAQAQKMITAYKGELEKYFTPDHPAYLSYENNQGVLWRMNGHFQDAYDLLFSVYNKYCKLLTKAHPSTISACVNVATVLRDLEDYDQSVKYYEEAIEMRKQTVGDQHPEYAMVLGMSAGAYRKKGDTQTAYRNLKEAYMVMANHYQGEECIPCAVILNSMGLLFKHQQKYERAIDSYERCLNIREKIQGPSHPDAIATRHNISELYNVWGKPEEAESMIKENLKYMEELREREAKARENHSHHNHHNH